MARPAARVAGIAAVALSPRADAADTAAPEVIARGAYLSKIMICNDCHTPFKMGPNGPEPDMSRQFSGHPENLVLPAPPPPAPAKN